MIGSVDVLLVDGFTPPPVDIAAVAAIAVDDITGVCVVVVVVIGGGEGFLSSISVIHLMTFRCFCLAKSLCVLRDENHASIALGSGLGGDGGG